MDKRKIIVLAVIIILIVGLGIFVFANPSNESLNENNNSNHNSTQNDDNDNLDDENTNDGDGEEGESENKPNIDNHRDEDDKNSVHDENQSPSTPSEPTTPSTPEEPAIDSSYNDALAAVIKAEETLLQTDVSDALTLIDKVTDDSQKTDLINRINEVQNVIDVTSLVQELQSKTESASDVNALNDARSFRETNAIISKVDALSESARKEELLNTLNTLAILLDDEEAPIINGISNNAIINDTSVINIVDTNDVAILLNGNEIELTNLSQNLLSDGKYTLVVVDAAFNSSEEINFEVDKTAPKVGGLEDGYVVNKKEIVTISDEHLASVTLNGVSQELSETGLSYSKTIASNGTYHFVATDKAGNVTDFTIIMDTNISKVVEIDSVEDLVDAIDNQADHQYWIIKNGTYLLPQGTKLIEGQDGWFFPITANDLTIVGEDNVTIKAANNVDNGAWATQNFVTIWGENVEINNITFIAQDGIDNPNKVIEILGNNAVLNHVTVNPNTGDFSGSIYINATGIKTTLNDVNLNQGRISLSGADQTNTLILNHVVVDLAGSSSEALWTFWNPNQAQVQATDFQVTVSSALTDLNDFIASLPTGTTLILDDGIYDLGHLEIANEINLKGTSVDNTIIKVNSDPISGQAGVYVKANGSISNLSIHMDNSSNPTAFDALKVSGNTYGSITDYKISNIEVIGGKNGINVHGVRNAIIDGVTVCYATGNLVSVASSTVTISNSNLALGGWNRVIAIAYKYNDVSYPTSAKVTIAANNIINGPILATCTDVDNEYIFEDPTMWQEVPYGENNSFYILVREN